MTLKAFDTSLRELQRACKFITNKRQAIDAVMQLAYRTVFTYEFQRQTRHFPHCYAAAPIAMPPFKGKEQEDIAGQCLNELLSLYVDAEPFEDMLIHVYGELLSFELGQHMTPPDVAKACAMLMLSMRGKAYFDSEKEISISDPACGTGALLLAQLAQIHSHFGDENLAKVIVHANDIDQSMCMATSLQLELHSIIKSLPYRRLIVHQSHALAECFTEHDKDKRFIDVEPNKFYVQTSALDEIHKRYK